MKKVVNHRHVSPRSLSKPLYNQQTFGSPSPSRYPQESEKKPRSISVEPGMLPKINKTNNSLNSSMQVEPIERITPLEKNQYTSQTDFNTALASQINKVAASSNIGKSPSYNSGGFSQYNYNTLPDSNPDSHNGKGNIQDLNQNSIYESPIQSRNEELTEASIRKKNKDEIIDLYKKHTDYFNHLKRDCICGQCTCGQCKCPSHPQPDLRPRVKGTTYQGDFVPQKFDYNNKNYQYESCPVSGAPLDLTTTYNQEFPPQMSERSPPCQPKGPDLERIPFGGATNYQMNYLPYGIPYTAAFKPADSPLMGGKFHQRTTYKDNYLGSKLQPVKPFKPIEKPPNNLPFIGETTHQAEYKPKELPQKYQSPAKHSIDPNLPFEGQYDTTHRHDYVPQTQDQCPTRVLINEYQKSIGGNLYDDRSIAY